MLADTLQQLICLLETNNSSLARAAGLDRSTVSKLAEGAENVFPSPICVCRGVN